MGGITWKFSKNFSYKIDPQLQLCEAKIDLKKN